MISEKKAREMLAHCEKCLSIESCVIAESRYRNLSEDAIRHAWAMEIAVLKSVIEIE